MGRRSLLSLLPAGIWLLAGCESETPVPSPPVQETNTQTSAPVAPQLASTPEVLLIANQAGRTIFVIDFAGSRAWAREVALADRKDYILEEVRTNYVRQAGKGKSPDQPVRLYAVHVPDRDEYKSGKYSRYEELAVLESTHQKLTAPGVRAAECFDAIHWQGQFKE